VAVLTRHVILFILLLLVACLVHGQKQNLFDSLVQAKMELIMLKKDTTSTGKEIRDLRKMLALFTTQDSLRTEMVVLRARLAIEEIKNMDATTRINELRAENRKLKKKLFIEAGATVVVALTSVYLLLK